MIAFFSSFLQGLLDVLPHYTYYPLSILLYWLLSLHLYDKRTPTNSSPFISFSPFCQSFFLFFYRLPLVSLPVFLQKKVFPQWSDSISDSPAFKSNPMPIFFSSTHFFLPTIFFSFMYLIFLLLLYVECVIVN